MKNKQEFKKYFDEEFASQKIKYNNKLKRAQKIANTCRFACIIYTLLYAIGIIALALSNSAYTLYIAVFGVIVFLNLLIFSFYDFQIKFDISQNFSMRDKEDIIAQILEDNYEFNKGGRVTLTEVKDADMFVSFDEISGEDYLKLNIKNKNNNCEYICSDIVLEELERNEENHIIKKDVFKGHFGYAVFTKNFKENIEININNHQKSFVEKKTNSEKFNSEFNVYSNKNANVDNILSSKVKLALLDWKQNLNAEIHIKIKKNRFNISFDKNLFNLNIDNEFTFKSVLYLYNDLSCIYKIIKDLSENEEAFE